jgi:hypothetical protein
MAEHAKLSPSAADRWMVCPGSVHLIDVKNITSKGGEAANRGTAVHTLSEKALKGNVACAGFLGTKVEGIKVTQEMVDIAQVYVDYIRALSGDKFYEQRVTVEELISDCWGTSDAIVCEVGKLTVGDLKSGSGFRVEAEDNKQLLIYALGAYFKYDWLYDFKEITMVIIQPPLDNISTWTITRDELMLFKEQLLEAKRLIDVCKDLFVITPKGCQWCPAKFACPAHHHTANQAAQVDFKTEAPKDLSYWLEKLPILKGFISSVEETAYGKLVAGEVIDGFALGKAAKRRAWADEDEVFNFVDSVGLTKTFFKDVLISPAQVDKLTLNLSVREQLNKFITFTESKQPIVKKDSAKSDFK